MTIADIRALMTPETDHPAWSNFVKEMEHRQYGHDALTQAWGWFKIGYKACLSDLKLYVKSLE